MRYFGSRDLGSGRETAQWQARLLPVLLRICTNWGECKALEKPHSGKRPDLAAVFCPPPASPCPPWPSPPGHPLLPGSWSPGQAGALTLLPWLPVSRRCDGDGRAAPMALPGCCLELPFSLSSNLRAVTGLTAT